MGNVPVYVVDLSSFYFLSHPLTIQWMTAISICHLNSGKLIASGLPPFATNFLLNDKTRKKKYFQFSVSNIFKNYYVERQSTFQT